jgi:hypothetical protein
MADQDSMDRGASSPRSNAAQELHDQGVVLIHVLAIYPTQVRLLELVRELTDDSGDFSEGDRVERAVHELIGVGLLFRCEGVVLPTRAALRFNQILDDCQSVGRGSKSRRPRLKCPMPPKATGQVVVRERAGGRTFGLRFRAYGRRRYMNLGTAEEGWSRHRAGEELSNILADVRRGIWRPNQPKEVAEPSPEPTFHEFASEWFDGLGYEGLSENTLKDYSWQLCNHLFVVLRGRCHASERELGTAGSQSASGRSHASLAAANLHLLALGDWA